MSLKRNHWTQVLPCLLMMVLILDSKATLRGGTDGVEICLKSIIPSLFPYLFLSTLLSANCSGKPTKLLNAIAKNCGIPKNSGNILLLGLLGGYPVGAQLIRQEYDRGTLSKRTASRMLFFCNNAGPAFIFGILSSLFDSIVVTWVLWGIHIATAVLIGVILPGKDISDSKTPHNSSGSLFQCFTSSGKAILNICGWVILFRIVITVMSERILFAVPDVVKVTICGLTELANGCIALRTVSNYSIRFVLSAAFLGFGGLCVCMQTANAAGQIFSGFYILVKVLHGCLSAILAIILSPLMFSNNIGALWMIPFGVICIGIFLFLFQKNSSNSTAYDVQYRKSELNEVQPV